MVEVAELFLPLDGEDDEVDGDEVDGDEVFPYWLPSSPPPSAPDGEIARRRHNRLPALAHRIPSDSDSGSDCLDDGEVRLALDLFDRGSPPHEGGAGGDMDPFPDAIDPFGFGVFDAAEEMGSDYLELGLGLGLGLGLRFGVDRPQEGEDAGAAADLGEEEEGSEWDGDGFLVGRRGMVLESSGGGGEPFRSRDGKGVRIVGFGLDSDSDDEEVFAAMSPYSDRGGMPDRMADDLGLPLCWDCLRIEEDRRDPNEDFEWEEVDGRVDGRVDERELLSVVMDADEDRSMAPADSNADLEFAQGAHQETVQSIDWEVLLAMDNLERNALIELEDSQSYLGEDHEDYVYASEYEIMFGQFADHDTSNYRSPPAAQSVMEHLPSVVLTQEDVANNNTLCAVCKDDISLEEKPKQLPCSHHYHGECILPWLKIRNTCPVCRYELPTDDPEYESWRVQRAGGSGHVR